MGEEALRLSSLGPIARNTTAGRPNLASLSPRKAQLDPCRRRSFLSFEASEDPARASFRVYLHELM
jgi:hypothetical protein